MKHHYVCSGSIRMVAIRPSLVAPGCSLLMAMIAIAASGCGAIAPMEHSGDASNPDDASSPVIPMLGFQGCPVVRGERPASSGTAATPQLAHLVLGAGTPGHALPGTAQIYDAESDATTLIVQVNGAAEHLACALSPDEQRTGQIDLGRLLVTSGSIAGSFLVYFGIVDSKGNIGGYATGTIAVGTPGPVSVCASPALPFQAMGKLPSAVTAVYADMNGTTEDYVLSSTPAPPLVIVRKTQLFLDIAGCSHLLVASDKTALAPVGWDNYLLIEYRSVPAAATGKAWYYGSATSPDIVDVAVPERIVRKEPATIPGTALDPPVPNANPFGHAPLAIDLMTEVPPNSHTFELTLYVLDFGGAGSTTDVWIFPQ